MTKNHPFLILKNNVTTEQQQHIKMNKTSVVLLNGPSYIFEVDNIIIIYNLLLSLLQKNEKKGSFKPKENCILTLPKAYAE